MSPNNKEAINSHFRPPHYTATLLPGQLEMSEINEGLSRRNRVKDVLSGGMDGLKGVGGKAIKIMSACGDWILCDFLKTEELAQNSDKNSK